MFSRLLSVHVFCGAVALAGVTVLALVFAEGADVELTDPRILLLMGGVLLGEARPLKLPLRGGDEEVNLSSTFSFALLLGFGIGPALAAQAGASLIQDIVSRKSWWRALFNVGQYCLAVGAAGGVLHLTGYSVGSPEDSMTVPALASIVLAGTVFFVVNFLTVGVAIALHLRIRLVRYLRSDVGFSAAMAAVLTSLGPIVLATVEQSPLLLALFVIPFEAVHRGGVQAARSHHDATHDSLTGLPNRSRFNALVEDAIGESSGPRGFAVMLLDLNRFKEINDTLGHQYGDRVLEMAGPRLAQAVDETVMLARLGGDEFALLVPDIADDDRIEVVVSRLLDALKIPFDIDGYVLDLDASIGIALFPQHGDDAHALLRSADVAMYRAKEHHLTHLRYSPEQDPHTPARLSLAGELRRALDTEGEIVVYYQPKVDIGHQRVVGVEALVRWRHPELGILSPDAFIPLAEQMGLIKPLTMRVLRDAVRDAARWRAAGDPLHVAVNISTRCLLDASLADQVADVLADEGGRPDWLTLEITESSIMTDPQMALQVMEELHASGITMSIDDFGTGYSSLAYLRDLPVSEIKIDRSFVSEMTTRPGSAGIVKSTIDLAQNLDLRVVAEGVEDTATQNHLHRLGCDELQGYLFSPPLDRGAFEGWLAGYNGRDGGRSGLLEMPSRRLSIA